MRTEKTRKGLLNGWFDAPFWDTRIRSANVHGRERWLGYVLGPFGVMLLQSIVNSYFNKYLTDTLGFTVTRGMWIAGFMVVFPVLSKLLDAITNVIMAKILDKTACRQGKLRPWFILSLPITVASILMMFAIPDMSAKAQAVWVVISYNLFYSVGYTMWYMAYELSAALSTRNVKQRSGNSIAGQITKNIGTGIVSILFPTLLSAIARGYTHGNDKQAYLVTLAFMCVVAVPLTFVQYFYTRECITEERRATEIDGEQLQIREAGFGAQLRACVKDRYWIMFIVLIFIYQVLNALKGVSQIYYAGWVVAGNAYGQAAAIQRRFTMISMAPMGPMLFVVVPLIKKFGRSKLIELYADQPAAATGWINFSYQGTIALTALLFLVLFLFFFDIDKRMPEVTHALVERKRAECAAKGIPYVSHEEQMKAEIAEQQKEAEEARVRELKELCAKKGLDFETENQKFLDKKARRDAKKAARKAKLKR